MLDEAIHAELWRKVKEYDGNLQELKYNFPGILDFYVRRTDGWQHEQMVAFYRNVIVDAIKEYDNNALSEAEYEALAWVGLVDTKYYRDGVSDEDKTKYSENYQKAIRNTTDSCN